MNEKINLASGGSWNLYKAPWCHKAIPQKCLGRWVFTKHHPNSFIIFLKVVFEERKIVQLKAEFRGMNASFWSTHADMSTLSYILQLTITFCEFHSGAELDDRAWGGMGVAKEFLGGTNK